MKAVFDAKARGEETLGFYDKMKSAFARAKEGRYRFVVAFAADRDAEKYSVAFVSRELSDKRAFADLDNFSWTMEQMEPLAVLFTDRPFLGMLKKDREAEDYFGKPVVNIPEAAKAYTDTKRLFIDKPRRAAFRVIDGGGADISTPDIEP